MASLLASEVAEQIIALTSSDAKKAVVSAQLARKALGKIEGEYADQIDKLWEDANAKALELLTLIKKNNPNKTADEIFARKDVQLVLKKPFDDAAAKSEALIREAWDKAAVDTEQKVKGEFKLGGHDWKGHELDEGVLDSIVGDLHANAGAMRDRYHDAFDKGGMENVGGVSRDSRRRAKYSLIVAIWEAANGVRDSAFALAGLNKMWVAVLDDATCSHCRWLHGKVITPGDQFVKVPKGIKPLKVYNDVLFGPPRHPNCRCILVATTLKKSK